RVGCVLLYFFFSSRRRHTRSKRDWSSDVCSSDLGCGRIELVIDLKFLRESPDVVRASQVTRGEDPQLVDQLLEADAARRSAILAADELRAEQKAFGKKIGQASPEERPALLEGSNELKERVKQAEESQRAAEEQVETLQYKLSNVVEGAPAGGEDDFVVLDHYGTKPQFDFEP